MTGKSTIFTPEFMEKAAKVDRYFVEHNMNDEQIREFVGENQTSQQKRPQVNILCAEAIGDGATASTCLNLGGEDLQKEIQNITVQPGSDVNILSANASGNGATSSSFVNISSRLSKIQQNNQ